MMEDPVLLEDYFSRRDHVSFLAQRDTSKSALDPAAFRRLSTPRIIKPSNHDRLDGVYGKGLGESLLIGIEVEEIEDAVYSRPVQARGHLKKSYSWDGHHSAEDESITFPSYQAGSNGDRDEDMSSQEDLAEAFNRDSMDDNWVSPRPSIHVDYLSHNWLEEDVWTSWKHVVVNKAVYINGPRLENASWRSWAKTRLNLGTIPPEAIQWCKDEDTTWLYGPFQRGTTQCQPNPTPARKDSALELELPLPKPILKTPSLLEIFAQRSLSDMSLTRPTSPATESRGSSTPPLTFSQEKERKTQAFHLHSAPNLALSAPERNVRFYDQVAQCISIVAECITCPKPCDCTSPSDTGALDALKTIELLPPTQLKGEPKPGLAGRANSWPTGNLPAPIPTAPARCKSEDVLDWISAAPSDAVTSQAVEAYLNDRSPTDEELFELEMFGSFQRGSTTSKTTRSGLPPSIAGGDLGARSSPSLSEGFSSGSDEVADDEEKYPAFPSFPRASPKSQRLLSGSTEDMDITIRRGEYEPWRFQDRGYGTASPAFSVQPANFAVKMPSRTEEAGMDDEEHWWMNV